jgi:hypothetical protein
MNNAFLEYALDSGYVHNWLVAGPHATPVDDLERFSKEDRAIEIARHYHKSISDILQPPVEWEPFQVGGTELAWRYYRCLTDHYVDLSAAYPGIRYVRAWAYAQIVSPSDQVALLTLTTHGPADVWLNRAHLHRQEHLDNQNPQSVSFQGTLQGGTNEILVRFEVTAMGDRPNVMALHLGDEIAPQTAVRLPVQHTNVTRRQKLERVFDQVHIEHPVSVRGANVSFRWDDEVDTVDEFVYWLQAESGMISLHGHGRVEAGTSKSVGEKLITLDQGPYHLTFIPPTHAIERYGIRYRKHLPFHVLDHAYSDAYYGTVPERRREALDHSVRIQGNLHAEIAKLALGQWAAVDQDVVLNAVSRTQDPQQDSVVDLLALLGALRRHAGQQVLPQDIEQAIQDSALCYRYAHDETDAGVTQQSPESGAILLHACEILAGQCYPDSTFSSTGHEGSWHRARGEASALEWLRARGAEGFADWDSHTGFERIIVALTHIFDLAEDERVREWAAIVLDKLLFTVAVNSFKGLFGSTHRHARASMIAGGQLEATSGITRLLWGMGVWNPHIAGLVSLAVSDYELPTMIASIATDLADEMWHRERHPGVNKATYRTADYMLSSAQDHHPGEQGDDQHIWQATLGPDAVVFVNHPACISQIDAQRPNFWAGNRVLPRVAQWKDVLVAVHKLPPDDWLGFCHAHFPVHEFDEWLIEDGWAFAHKGHAYMALACSQAPRLVKRGPAAFRELRAQGSEQVWLCMMGREATDGSFAAFREKIQGLQMAWQELGVQCETLRSETLSFGWTGPLRVDGVEQSLAGQKHYDGPHCTAEWPAAQMDIQYGEYTVRLRFDG